jgi:carboxyl-terminal processing protease
MENKKFNIWLPLLISISMALGIFLGYKLRDGIPGQAFFYREKGGDIKEIMQLVDRFYVDSISTDSLSDTAIQAMLAKLDPHSVYIPAEELQQINDEISGSFFGIGVEFNIFDDTVHVINVIPEGPSSKAGLQTGDKLLRADDGFLSGKKLSADGVRKLLKGPEGSQVTVIVLRNGKQIPVKITRGIIPLTSLDAAYMMNDNIGYIRLNKFSQQTYREFMAKLEELKGKGMKQLIFDLRGNGGGVLDEAVEIADEFLDGDKLITYTEGEHLKRKEYRCRRQGQFEEGKLIILTDEATASASEIIAGALQDWERATIIGRRTFGKGLVQEQFDLGNGGALRLTVARYFTPLGRSIQRSYANGGRAYYEEISNRFEEGGEYWHTGNIKQDTGKKYKTRSGKILFGGGGISPDVVIQGDTSRMSDFITRVFMSGIVNYFGYRYLIGNPSITKEYSNPENFAKSFNLGADGWSLFENLVRKDSIIPSVISASERNYLNESLKRSLARQLWRNEGFYRMLNANDSAIKKAMVLMK